MLFVYNLLGLVFKFIVMTKAELVRLMESGEKLMLVDVREPEELTERPTIEGAVNVTIGQMILGACKGTLAKDKKIVTICGSGGRCQIVVRELAKRGYDVDYLEGGVKAWNAD